MTRRFSLDDNGLEIDGSAVGINPMTAQVDDLLGSGARVQEIVIQRKVEAVARFYDDEGFGLGACLLCGKVSHIWINFRADTSRKTATTFRGKLSIRGVGLSETMKVRELLAIEPDIRQTFRTDLRFAIGEVGVFISARVPRRAGPNSSIALGSVDLSFRHEQVAPYKSCIG